MNDPTVATVKRLFAVSGNRCAFPKCPVPLVDAASGKVTGRICHIRAQRPGGPRYDPGQSDIERHGFDNLLLMCPVHHDVIDSDETSYTVERLVTLKQAHEATRPAGSEPTDAIAQAFLTNIAQNSTTDGSIIFSQHQMGGQVAHSITNVGPQPRQISQSAANALVSELRQLAPEKVNVTALLGDSEANHLASVLKDILADAGWNVEGVDQGVFLGLPRGIVIQVCQPTQALMVLLEWAGSAGLQPTGNHDPGATGNTVIVGANF